MNSKQLAWLIRRHCVEMANRSGCSHIASVFSVADVMAVLYTDILSFDPKNPKWDERDRFVLSKGHAGASVYISLAENGFFDTKELLTHYRNGSRLSGHVSHALPGVDFSTGSLGHGLSAAAGMALAAKQDGKNHRVFAVLGDGECNEGSVWEAALFANHYRLENLVAVVDHNHMQSLDYCEKTLELEDFGKKWSAFGWNVIELDGHDHDALKNALSDTKNIGHRPTVIIADTTKGKGVSFMESDILWHYRFPHDGWEYQKAVSELFDSKPEGIEDPYTPEGLPAPDGEMPEELLGDHTTGLSWHPTYFGQEDRK